MHIQAVDRDGIPVPNSHRHVDKREAAFLISAGVAVAVAPRRETCQEAQARVEAIHGSTRTTPATRWSVRPASTINEQRYPPQVYAKCAGCSADFFAANPRKSITTPFVHGATCSFVREFVPDEIAKDYEVQRDSFYPVRSVVAVVTDRLAEFREARKMGAGQ
jgi:hypothetical protein